jgi:iron(III) transport system permease protein
MLRPALVAVALLLALPVLSVLAAWAMLDSQALASLRHLASTVLAGYVGQTAFLAVAVSLGVTLLGAGAAASVTLFEFPGRRSFEWLMLLPLAMPAYVLAYAYTDMLQFSGVVQTALRERLGVEHALWPDIRSLPGAAVLFVLCLYPYVYLLTRAALAERGVQMMEAARMLGAGLWRRIGEVALPLSRPAIAAGVALALMETMADYGVGSYFGLTTFSTGIYKSWLAMNDPVAAAILASMLLGVVALLLTVERRAQRKLRFVPARAGQQAVDSQPAQLRGGAALFAWTLCAIPVGFGFLFPVAWLLKLVVDEARHGEFGLPLARFVQWSAVSFRYALAAAVLATLIAVALAFAQRTSAPGQRLFGRVAGFVSLGYAVPGAVIAVGILLPLGWLQGVWPAAGVGAWITATSAAVVYAYLVRFSAVALQSVESGYARVPMSVDDTARTLGAGSVRLLREVHAPLLRRSMAAAGLLVFVDVMKELPATLVLRPFDRDTLAVVAYNFARDERLAEAALPSLAIVAVGLIPVLMLSRVLRGQAGQGRARDV